MNQPTQKRRRWFRVSLRTLLSLLTVFCVVFGWHMHGVRVQRDAVARLQALGAYFTPDSYSPSLSKPSLLAANRWWPPIWMVERLGPDHFTSVVKVQLHGPPHRYPGTLSEWSKKVVEQLQRLPKLRRVSYCPGRDQEPDIAVYRSFARLKQVESLDIRGDTITGRAMEPLVRMPNLRHLHFQRTGGPDDSAYEVFARMPAIETIGVESTTADQRALLKRRRPEVELYEHYDYAP